MAQQLAQHSIYFTFILFRRLFVIRTEAIWVSQVLVDSQLFNIPQAL